MVTSASAPEDESRRLPQVAATLRACRELYLSAYEEGIITPQPDSVAARDFQATETGPSGEWPVELNQLPRGLAAKLIRQQADHCHAVAVLIESDEVSEPLHSVARSGLEFAIRAFWVLDPGVPHRTRCARAALAELVSISMTRRAASKLPDSPDLRAARNQVRADAKAYEKRLRELFAVVENKDDNGDPLKWTIENVAYPSWTAAADSWTRAEDTGVSGGAMYDQLSILAHPQGFSATVGLRPDPNDGAKVTRVIEALRVIKVARLSAQAFYSGVTMLANYHGYKSDRITKWDDQLTEAFPGFFHP